MNKTYTEEEVVSLFAKFLKLNIDNKGWAYIVGSPSHWTLSFKVFINDPDGYLADEKKFYDDFHKAKFEQSLIERVECC